MSSPALFTSPFSCPHCATLSNILTTADSSLTSASKLKAWPPSRQGLPRARYCSPRHRMPFKSRNEGSQRVSMTWRASPDRPYLVCHLLHECMRGVAARGAVVDGHRPALPRQQATARRGVGKQMLTRRGDDRHVFNWRRRRRLFAWLPRKRHRYEYCPQRHRHAL